MHICDVYHEEKKELKEVVIYHLTNAAAPSH